MQAGIGCVGASRMLAGDSSSVDLSTPDHHTSVLASSTSGLWQQLRGDGAGGSAAGGDPKVALLGMGLILLSQVRTSHH